MELKAEARRYSGEELFLLEIGQEYFAYYPLRHTSLKITPVAYEAALSGDSALLAELDGRIRDKEKIKINVPVPSNSFEPHRVDLALSTKCNLACHYCHADSNAFVRTMDWPVATKAIDFILQNAAQRKVPYAQVGFNGGGEPTATFALLRKVVDYSRREAARHQTEVRFGMASNGYYSDSVSEYVDDNFSHVAISLDGPQDIHDAHRPNLAGTGSFERVFSNAKRLHDSGKIKNFNIRATVSALSVDRLEEIVRFFLAEFPRAGYAFMPLNRLGRGETCSLAPPAQEAYVDQFARILLEKELCPLDQLFFMCGTLSTVRSTFCDAFSGPGFNLSVDGRLTACQRDNLPNEFYFGSVDPVSGIEVDYDCLNRQKELRIETDDTCIDCFAKYHCGGECMDLVIHGQPRCAGIRRWTAHQIKDLHANHEVPTRGSGLLKGETEWR